MAWRKQPVPKQVIGAVATPAVIPANGGGVDVEVAFDRPFSGTPTVLASAVSPRISFAFVPTPTMVRIRMYNFTSSDVPAGNAVRWVAFGEG